MWSLTANWGGFGGFVAKDWTERERSTEEMYGEVFGAVSQIPGLRVFPRLDPPLPTPGQYDVELVLQSDLPPEQMLETVGAVVGAGWQSGKFLYVDTDLKIDLPQATVVIDRDMVADLGLDLATVGRELGTLLGGGYVNRFNYFDRSYKVIPQIGEEDRATVAPLLDLKIKAPSGELIPVSTFTRIETHPAPRTLNRFGQQNAVRIFGGVKPGVTKDEGLTVLEAAATAAAAPGMTMDYAGESRQIRLEGGALVVTLGFAVILIYLVLAAQFQSFRDPLIVLLGSVPLAISGALLFSFLDLTTINIYSQVGLITLVGLIAKNGILIVEFANRLQEGGLDKLAALREASVTRLRPVLMTTAATVFGHFPLVLVTGPGSAARNSIGTILVAGMAVGTMFTLFVVPVFYSLIARDHRAVARESEPAGGLQPALEGVSHA
jgi:multidrug efflux pump